MKKLLFSVLAIAVAVCSSASDVDAMRALISRLLPEQQSQFVVEKLPQKNRDYFSISSRADKIVIAGNNANSMAVGLNHYLKYWCHANVSWYAADGIAMPEKLPTIDKTVTVEARCDKRFFLNYCTFGYTMPWWGWKDWEHFIDWLALQGVNLPLAITGQESIWYKVWTQMGLTDKEVRDYFTGPAHLPWHRMLNIDYWQGNVPMSWLDNQEELQKKIVARERELNMHPVLPAFAGHVPQELHRIFPAAKINKLSRWGGFTEDYVPSFLDPTDPLFAKIQKAYLTEQRKLFGTDHVYGIDVFNEMVPPSWEPEYLARVSREVYNSVAQLDKQAVWLQMTWLFYYKSKDWTAERVDAYLSAVPKDKQLLLDYYCEKQEVWKRTDKFFGVPYLWCYLGNFGGNTALVGNLQDINDKIENAYVNGGENFVGLGATLEGFDCNPFMYEFIFEKAWNIPAHKSLNEWVDHMADQRTGCTDTKAREAWHVIIDNVYRDYTRSGQCSMTNARPTLGKASRYAKTQIRYSNKALQQAIGELFESRAHGATFESDAVNLVRQMLGNYFGDLFAQYKKAYDEGNIAAMRTLQTQMQGILADMDRLLATRSDFLLGKWIADARAIGTDDAEKLYYERNARNLISTWGDRGISLNDYANRSWAGMMQTYYAPRWAMFFDAVNAAVEVGEKFDDVQEKAYKNRVMTFEKRWWTDCRDTFAATPVGDKLAVAKELYAKYAPQIATL